MALGWRLTLERPVRKSSTPVGAGNGSVVHTRIYTCSSLFFFLKKTYPYKTSFDYASTAGL